MKKKNFAKYLRKQSDKANKQECTTILNELSNASKEGEYTKFVNLKINQVHYLKKLGLKIESTDKFGFYKITWERKQKV